MSGGGDVTGRGVRYGTALVREVSQSLPRCLLSYIDRSPIDVSLAVRQHEAYCEQLAALGLGVVRLPRRDELPDAVFVEDTAVVLDELAVLGRPGNPARRAEVGDMEEALSGLRPLHHLPDDATLDGGDVLRIDRRLFVGLSRRTNQAGVRALANLVADIGYTVIPVEVSGCLHLKSACSDLGDRRILVQPGWIDPRPFDELGFEPILVDPEEPDAANVLRVGDTILHAAERPRTAERLARSGCTLAPLSLSELMKAEAGLTCLSVIV